MKQSDVVKIDIINMTQAGDNIEETLERIIFTSYNSETLESVLNECTVSVIE